MLTQLEDRLKLLICQISVDVEFILAIIVKISRVRFQKEYDKVCKMINEATRLARNAQVVLAMEDADEREEREKAAADGAKVLLQSAIPFSNAGKGEKQSVRYRSVPEKGKTLATDSLKEKFDILKKKNAVYEPPSTKYPNYENYVKSHDQSSPRRTKHHQTESSTSPRRDTQTDAGTTDRGIALTMNDELLSVHQSGGAENHASGTRTRKLTEIDGYDSKTQSIDLQLVIEGSQMKKKEIQQPEPTKKYNPSPSLLNSIQPITTTQSADPKPLRLSKTSSPTKINLLKNSVHQVAEKTPGNCSDMHTIEQLVPTPPVRIYSSELWKAYDLMGLEFRPVPIAYRPEYKRALIDKVYHDLSSFNFEIKKGRERYFQLHTEYLKKRANNPNNERSILVQNDVTISSNVNISRDKSFQKTRTFNFRGHYSNSLHFYRLSGTQNPLLSLSNELIPRGGNTKAGATDLNSSINRTAKRQNPRIPTLNINESQTEDKYSKQNRTQTLNSTNSPTSHDTEHNPIDVSSPGSYSNRSSSILREQREKKIEMRYFRSKEAQNFKISMHDNEKQHFDSPSFYDSFHDPQTISANLGRSLEITEHSKPSPEDQQKPHPENIFPLPAINGIDGTTKVFPKLSPYTKSSSLPRQVSENAHIDYEATRKNRFVKLSAMIKLKGKTKTRISGLDEKDSRSGIERILHTEESQSREDGNYISLNVKKELIQRDLWAAQTDAISNKIRNNLIINLKETLKNPIKNYLIRNDCL